MENLVAFVCGLPESATVCDALRKVEYAALTNILYGRFGKAIGALMLIHGVCWVSQMFTSKEELAKRLVSSKKLDEYMWWILNRAVIAMIGAASAFVLWGDALLCGSACAVLALSLWVSVNSRGIAQQDLKDFPRKNHPMMRWKFTLVAVPCAAALVRWITQGGVHCLSMGLHALSALLALAALDRAVLAYGSFAHTTARPLVRSASFGAVR